MGEDAIEKGKVSYNYLCNKGIGAFWECVSNAEEWLACTTEVVVFTITSVRADE